MVMAYNSSKFAYFTVDFECFTHDFCRSVGARKKPRLRTDQLIRSLHNIQNILASSNHASTNITFFCTGISADLYPDILKEIAALGHEIACHGNFHDDVNKMKPEILYTELKLAQDKLSNVTNKEVIGFRAPRFSIDKLDFERLDIISRLFKYDSSLHFENETEFQKWKSQCPVDIIELPVPRQSLLNSKFKAKLGGSYLKLFPSYFVKHAATKSIQNGLIPIFYLHPYDLFFGYSLLASWNELKGTESRLYWYIRQFQWVGLFNWAQEKKLNNLLASFSNLGTLEELMQDLKEGKNSSL
jgi:hypothetical protein